jgi:phage tail sheath protein FI
MPEYLAPGVYVEEVSYRSKSIEGVSTTTTGFVGPTRYGPVAQEPQLVTSLIEFERMYGDRQQLVFDDVGPMHNFMWHSARAFFEQGGRRLYVKRIFNGDVEEAAASLDLGGGAEGGDGITIRARFPGAAGGRRVRIAISRGPSVLGWTGSGADRRRSVGGLRDGDVVWISEGGSPPAAGGLHIVRSGLSSAGELTWFFDDGGSPPGGSGLDLDDLVEGASVHLTTLSVTDYPSDPGSIPITWAGLAIDPAHTTGGAADSLFDQFAEFPANQTQALTLPFVIERGENLANALDVLEVIFDAAPDGLDLRAALGSDTPESQRSYELALDEGSDGDRPTASEYEGEEIDTPLGPLKTGLVSFEDIDDISIVAAPGSTFGFEESEENRDQAATVQSLLISHAQRMRYRIAVLDSGDRQGISAVRAMRATIDSSYAAFYYPWVTVMDPVTQAEIELPPSGFVAGIYARNDINRAVYKAPANEVVNLAIGFETLLNKGQQDVLNPEGINCFRYFEGRGFRLWGARTASSDPEWKYVNLRRYFCYLEHSIDRGTQWAVFEPNGEALWANVRRTIEDFLFNEWQMGALLGDKPEKAYFVKCDRSTMTQNDLDNGRLVCLIGVAALRPAEFVIFRIGQWTSDARR